MFTKKFSVALMLSVCLMGSSVFAANVMIDDMDSSYTSWVGSNGTSPQGNVATPKTEGAASMEVLTNNTASNGKIVKTIPGAGLDLTGTGVSGTGNTGLEFDLYLPASLPGNSGLTISLWCYPNGSYWREMKWTIGAAEITSATADTWATVHLGWQYRTDIPVTGYLTSFAESSFNGVPISAANGSSTYNYNTYGSNIKYLHEMYIMMDSDDGNDKTWYVDNIRAVPEPATMGLLAFGGIATLIRRKR